MSLQIILPPQIVLREVGGYIVKYFENLVAHLLMSPSLGPIMKLIKEGRMGCSQMDEIPLSILFYSTLDLQHQHHLGAC